jgi:site-specific recombinase XerD
MRYPADPPTIEEIVTSRATPATASTAGRLRALIVVLWRAGLRICDALTLAEADPGTRGAGRCWCGTATAAAAARTELRRVARQAGVRRRSAPHQLRHAHAVEMAREGVPLILWWVE